MSTFVSLGPGDGHTDRQLADAVGKATTPLTYVPVDISEGILESAFSVLSSHAYVPAGIMADFEDRMPFVASRLNKLSVGTGPVLVPMLGNTFGNLDGYETGFMNSVAHILKPQDYLLLEVAVRDDTPTEVDNFKPLSSHSKRLRYFYANGLARRLHQSVDGILASYDQRIRHAPGRSDVPDALAKNIIDTDTGHVLINIRRYQWEAFLKWLSGFPFEQVYRSRVIFDGRGVGSGIVLLRYVPRL